MASSGRTFPIIDFSAYSLQRNSPDSETFTNLIDSVRNSVSSNGFLYLSNHGISKEEVDKVFSESRKFFELPKDIKAKYRMSEEVVENHGYVESGRETLNSRRPADFKESFNYRPKLSVKVDNVYSESRKFFELPKDIKAKYRMGEEVSENHGYVESGREILNRQRPADFKESFNYRPKLPVKKMPQEELPDFEKAYSSLYQRCAELGNRVLEVLARSLNLEDPYHFVKATREIHSFGNETMMRCVHYFAMTKDTELKEDQIRCGEHSDFCLITLLFQDDKGGLEVQTQDGEFIPVVPIEGTVVVNIGDFMQRWTADKLVSNVHRVVMPTTDGAKHSSRFSIAFFYNADKDHVATCIDGSDKYQPITMVEFMKQKLEETYKY
ncbi:uncharacterized protein [Ptychodera flava]|uniref:uncharacterized protein isoform X2 n=1 Tax=Ptychodera flava TaxID=63121 RepID=UPI003969D308